MSFIVNPDFIPFVAHNDKRKDETLVYVVHIRLDAIVWVICKRRARVCDNNLTVGDLRTLTDVKCSHTDNMAKYSVMLRGYDTAMTLYSPADMCTILGGDSQTNKEPKDHV